MSKRSASNKKKSHGKGHVALRSHTYTKQPSSYTSPYTSSFGTNNVFYGLSIIVGLAIVALFVLFKRICITGGVICSSQLANMSLASLLVILLGFFVILFIFVVLRRKKL